MYTIDQEIANKIARTTPMKYREMEELFRMDEEAADQYEMELRKEVESQADGQVARAVVAYLPLYLESQAITSYINRTGNQMLRRMMPEILTAEEAAMMAQKDIMTLTVKQVNQVAQILREQQKRLKNAQQNS